ncbi:MAG: restriction endonuclease subunit S, partial [Candidatus Weimeria sp.]
GRSFAGEDISNYKVVHNGDIIYTKSPLQAKPYGIIKIFEGKSGIVSPLYVVNKAVDGIDPRFIYYLFDIPERTNNYLRPLVRKGAKNTMNISDDEWLSGEIMVSTYYQEQHKIGAFFLSLDNLITLHQRKLDTLQNLKKSMLEKMFPKEGETKPEIRFEGFTDDWEQRKVGDIFKEYSEKNHEELPALTIIQGHGTVRRDDSDRNLQYSKNSLSNYKLVNKGDFIVHLRSFEGGLEVANSQGIVSPAYHLLHGEATDSRFYYLYFRSNKFINIDLKPCVYGIRDGRSIDINEMMKIEIPWTSYEEQKKIGDFFESFDKTITLHQRKLESLRHLKSALLDKMFV